MPYGTADPSFTGGPGVDWKPVPREPGSIVTKLPMTALLSQALVAFAIEYESERRGPMQWAANILRGVDDDGSRFPPLPSPGTHSVPNLERLGIVGVARDGGVRLTPTGRAMRDAYEPLCERIEGRWRQRLGSSLIDDIVDAVRVDGEWRPFPLVAWTGADFVLLSGNP